MPFAAAAGAGAAIGSGAAAAAGAASGAGAESAGLVVGSADVGDTAACFGEPPHAAARRQTMIARSLMLKPYTMRVARWALVLLVAYCVAGAGRAAAGPKPDPAELSKLDQQLSQLQVKQAYVPAIKVARKLLDLQIQLTGKDSPEADRRRMTLASALSLAGDYDEERKLYAELLANAEKAHGPDSKQVLQALQMLSGPDWQQMRYQEVEPIMQRQLALSKKLDGDDSIEYARVLMQYGGLLNARNEYSSAVRAYEQALKIFEAKLPKNDFQLAQTVQVLASFYWMANDKPKAIALYDRAIKIAEGGPNSSVLMVGSTMWGVAAMYHWGGRDDLAKPIMKKIVAMYDKEVARLEKDKPDDYQLSPLLGMGGYLSQQSGDLPGAEQRLVKAIAIDEKRSGMSGYSFMLADVRRAQGKPKEALALLEKLSVVTAKSPTAAGAYDPLMADILRDMGDYKRAEKLLLGRLPTIERMFGRRHPSYGSNELSLANLYMAAGDVPKAEHVLADSLELAEKELQLLLQTGTEADHAAYSSRNAYRLDSVVNFNYSLAPKNAAVSRLAMTTLLRRKGRALDASAATMATIRAKLSPADKQLLDDLAAARNKLAKLTVAGPSATGDGSDYAKEVAALEDQVQKLELEVGKKSAAYRAATAAIELPAIQKLVPKDARLVELVNFQPGDVKKSYQYQNGLPLPARRYGAYVLAGTGDPTFVDLGPAADIDAAVEKFRKAVADPNNAKVTDLGRALYDLTIAKIAPSLGNATEILIAPDGALAVVPFSALVDAKGNFLVQKYNFTYLTSGRDLLRLKVQTKSQGGGVIFADPAFDATQKTPQKPTQPTSRGRRSAELAELSWPALPGTGQEAAAVVKTLKNMKLYTGAAATESAVKAIHGPKILHLATHGFFLPDEAKPPGEAGAGAPKIEVYENPLLRSGLALAGANKLSSGDDDGILTALEASGLDLEGTKLVVLSACETGVGKVTNGEGVYGLRRSLIVAGAESLVMSLWQVDDQATKDLMVGYYQRLAQGHARSTALREVQLELAGSAKYKHPYYWASFLAAGDNSPLRD
jgi:CHAT domain-containing protein